MGPPDDVARLAALIDMLHQKRVVFGHLKCGDIELSCVPSPPPGEEESESGGPVLSPAEAREAARKLSDEITYGASEGAPL